MSLATSLGLVDELNERIARCEQVLRAQGAAHRYVPLLRTVPGIDWLLAYTIAAEIGDIGRFSRPERLVGYTGLCPRVYQSGTVDRRGPLAKTGPKYLRWALIEAASNACKHPRYHDRYLRTKRRLAKQRGSKVARIELARELAGVIWHMLARQEPFRAAGPSNCLVA